MFQSCHNLGESRDVGHAMGEVIERSTKHRLAGFSDICHLMSLRMADTQQNGSHAIAA
jgi:hypothetical protein